MSSEHRGEYAQGVVAFTWWSGSGALCMGARFAGDALALRGCLTAEVGRLGARPSDTREPQDANRLWAALGPGVLLQWDALPPLVLGAGVEAPFALVRDRFLLADAAVHRAPVLGFRGEILLGVRLW
jgi:hypothetical protein